MTLTCPVSGQVSSIHHRQPVGLRRSEYPLCLRDGQAAMELPRHEGPPQQRQTVNWEEDCT